MERDISKVSSEYEIAKVNWRKTVTLCNVTDIVDSKN